MSFLGLGYGPSTPMQDFIQGTAFAVARNTAMDIELRNKMRRMRGGMNGLGATPAPYRQGTRAWWIWYATVYLPQYYSQQQILQYVQRSPYYTQFGSPFNYGQTPYQNYQYPYPTPQNVYSYPYSTYNYPQQYGYNSYNQYSPYNQYGQYVDPYGQAQYTQYQGQQGAAACQAQGGYFDYTQQTCNAIGQQQQYGSGSFPNVVGLPEAQAVQLLNQSGYNVWELNRDGYSQGAPPSYQANRVDISTQNGIVTAAAIG